MTVPYQVSVIVPVYKVENYLPKCIDSLLNQTLPAVEIILVDDGSPDGSGRICDAYAQRDARVRVLHKTNEGVMKARLSGLEMASAPYVGFVDGDDFVAPDMYETLWKEADERRAQVVCCSMIRYWNEEKQQPDHRARRMSGFYDEKNLDVFYSRFFSDNTPNADKCSIAPSLCDKLFERRMILERYRKVMQNGEKLFMGEDMLITYSCLLQAKRISVMGEYTPYYYVYRESSAVNGFKSGYLDNTESLLKQLKQMSLPEEAEQPVGRAISRYASYTALRVIQGIVPKEASVIKRWKGTRAVLRRMKKSPLWQELLLADGNDLFKYTFEKLLYRMMRNGMAAAMAVGSWLHENVWLEKKRK